MLGSLARSLSRIVARIEDALLAGLGLALLAAAAAQLLFRVFGAGPVWLDPLMRTATLWLALIGALVATREGRQLHIDVLARRLPRRLEQGARLLVAVFTAAVCALLAQASWTLLVLEREGGGTAFAGLPNWWLLAILPLVFALMALHALGQLARGPDGQATP
jgi:TRAP-type C4-dicarboxylate transport system permease small subunit